MRIIITFLLLFSIRLCAGIGVGESNTGPLKAEVEPGLLKYVLAQNYPNPFNPSTVIAYSITTSSNVLIEVYNLLGKRITTLVNKYQTAGSYSVNFDARGLSNGIYYYKLQAGSFTATKKNVVIKINGVKNEIKKYVVLFFGNCFINLTVTGKHKSSGYRSTVQYFGYNCNGYL